MTELRYYKGSADVTSPSYATEDSSCFDIYTHLIPKTKLICFTPANKEIAVSVSEYATVTIKPLDRILIPTGLIFEIDRGFSLRLHIRSAVALKMGLVLANSEAIFDSDSVHETFIMLMNNSNNAVKINNNERLVQGEIVPVYKQDLVDTSEPE